MGQYFKAVNIDKQEYVCPYCMGELGKLWEWTAGRHGAVFTLLLRKSDGGGGGDYNGYATIVGRWAGDRVMLVGDYDSSRLWDRLPQFRNVSKELVEAWNEFIDLPDMKLMYKHCSGCKAQQTN